MTVSIGVIGAGALGYHHVRLLRGRPEATLVGFYDSSAERAAQVTKELGVPAFQSVDALLDQVQAAVLVVPTKAHHDVAIRALHRGIHLLIEKPIAATLEQADDIVRLAADKRALVQVGHVERFNRALRAAAPYIDAPRFIESERLAPFNPRGTDVAVVLDLMIHDIDLVHALVRDKVRDVRAVGVGVLTNVDMTNAWLAFESGAVANIKASRVARDRLRKLRIFQKNGYFSLDLGAGTGEFYRLKADIDVAELSKSAQSIEKFVERIKLKAPDGEPLRLEHDSFIAAVRGEAPMVVTGEDGRDALAVALRIVDEVNASLPALQARPGQPYPALGRA
ncbi:MAG TPA: Gfo/Idh/MocA family oxidoreductase [Gemmatimonadaceae bacterium]|nr:Gfo/Idh/MocA family oxidoreductase [Gemmatimonadaceae bacterium]